MPYIKKEDRRKFTVPLMNLQPETEGELNYCISMLCHDYLKRKSNDDKYSARYATHNSVIGVLDCAKMELYRRLTAPYEDKVMKENGDI